jgi:hypothetical protein
MRDRAELAHALRTIAARLEDGAPGDEQASRWAADLRRLSELDVWAGPTMPLERQPGLPGVDHG